MLERLRFICITSSNLDEFFEVRMAGLKEQMRTTPAALSPDGMSLQHVYDLVVERAHELVHRAVHDAARDGAAGARSEGIYFHGAKNGATQQTEWIRDYFFRELLPVLTPIGLDPAHPFPRVFNKSLNFAVELEGKDAFGRRRDAAIVQAPRALPRLIRMPQAMSGAAYGFVLLCSLDPARAHRRALLRMNVRGCNQFRVTRN